MMFEIIYALGCLGDWLQAAHLFNLYEFYGFEIQQIATLFVVGFASAAFSGFVSGPLIDKFGRRLGIQCYCIIYAISCMLMHYQELKMLLLGRFLGGFATTLLYTTFETWVNGHVKHDTKLHVPNQLRRMWVINASCAIISGPVSQFAIMLNPKPWFVGDLMFGSTTNAFDVAAFVLLVCCILSATLDENYGGNAKSQFSFQLIRTELRTMKKRARLFLIGNILFEAGVFIFIFTWVPLLSGYFNESIWYKTHGAVFMLLMSFNFSGAYVSNHKHIGSIAAFTALSLGCCLVITTPVVPLCFVELGIGFTFPVMAVFRGVYIDDDVRGTLCNLIRIPINFLILSVLLSVSSIPVMVSIASSLFLLSSALFVAST